MLAKVPLKITGTNGELARFLGVVGLFSVMGTKNITDMDIQALVDGHVDEKTSVRLLDAITHDPALYNRYLVYQKQKNLLKAWWKDN